MRSLSFTQIHGLLKYNKIDPVMAIWWFPKIGGPPFK